MLLRRLLVQLLCAIALVTALLAPTFAQSPPAGVREAAWSPDGKRLAVSRYDAVWTMAPDGKGAKRVVPKPGDWIAERDPAWSPDGKSLAFSASSAGQFDVWIAPASGGTARRVTSLSGDERWPSWTRDGRIVFSHREPRGAWQLFVASVDGAGAPAKLTPDAAGEWQGRVSPDGARVAFVSDREPESGNETDIWVRDLPAAGVAAQAPSRGSRVTRFAGDESFPAWAPDNARVAYAAIRGGRGNGVWVSVVPASDAGAAIEPAGRGGQGRAAGRGPGGPGAGAAASGPDGIAHVLASRKIGVPAWSPDSETLAIATFPIVAAGYNGNPNRNDDEPPITLSAVPPAAAGSLDPGGPYTLWRVEAPRAIDEGAATVAVSDPDDSRWAGAFDQVWQTLKSLYYHDGPSAPAWDAVRAKHRAQAAQAKDVASAEAAIDALVAEQPLIKPAVESNRAVVASAHPLASAAGARVLEQGGNVVDAGIAVAFALGVVEPDASSVGGDGQAILFLNGMTEPVVIEYKDMTPSRIGPDNARLFTPTGARTATDGPSVTNIPGVVAGLDLLYQKYGSKKVAWADLVAPAIAIADEGWILDDALVTSIAEGRAALAKYPESAKVFLPGGRVPRVGERFTNKDYAETLRILAREGGQSFYRGTIAQRIAADFAENGGVITLEDLAQYRAIERKPLAGRYRGHLVYSVPAPVSNGLQMVETLNILDHYRPRPSARYTTDADYLHHVIEAWRVRDGGARIADPERWPVDYGSHLDPAHAAERFKLIDPKKVYTATGGRGGGPAVPGGRGFSSGETAESDGARRVETGTTAFVVADAEGNMIAFTQTLSTWGGNYYVSKGLGFLYNDHFRGGRGGTGFGSTLPLMRSSTTSVPTLVFAPVPAGVTRSSGIPGYIGRLAAGCAGNAWIPASVYNVILNVIDGGMTAQQAIEAPRLLIGGGAGGGSRVQIEDRLPRALLADLEARGHTFVKVGRKGEVMYGYAAVAVVDASKGTVAGGADPRRSHAVAAPGGR
jgi:gamma-glutamyltranspeptidase/glutathione hydrolase